MKTRSGRGGAARRDAALFHVVLRGCRPEPLVRDECDWRKMEGGIEAMLFWCGGRVLGYRYEADCLELAVETAQVRLGDMFRYLVVSYALHFNRTRHERGQVFRPLRAYRLEKAFRAELVFWLHRPLMGKGWTADAAYLDPGKQVWVDTSDVLEELGRGVAARRYYRQLRAQGVQQELVEAFTSRRGVGPYRPRLEGAVVALSRRHCRALLRSVVTCVAEHEAVTAREMMGRSRVRRVCRARCLVTVVAVRCGVSLREIGVFLNRDGTTLQESVLRLRARDRRGLLDAVDAVLAAVRSGGELSAFAETNRPLQSQDGGGDSQGGSVHGEGVKVPKDTE